LKDVVRVTGVERARLFRGLPRPADEPSVSGPRNEARPTKETSKGAPAFSRLELSAPLEAMARPLFEIQTATGVKVRVFEETPEMLKLLSAACGFGGAR
jgi:hypothetical protein